MMMMGSEVNKLVVAGQHWPTETNDRVAHKRQKMPEEREGKQKKKRKRNKKMEKRNNKYLQAPNKTKNKRHLFSESDRVGTVDRDSSYMRC